MHVGILPVCVGIAFPVGGDHEAEADPFGRIEYADGAVVDLDQPLDEIEPDPASPAVVVVEGRFRGLVITFEDVADLVVGDLLAVVGDVDLEIAAGAQGILSEGRAGFSARNVVEGHRDGSSVRRVFQGIGEQVAQDFFQFVQVDQADERVFEPVVPD